MLGVRCHLYESAQQGEYESLGEDGHMVTVSAVRPRQGTAEGCRKKVVNVFGSLHTSSNRQFGVEFVKRLPHLIERGEIMVRVQPLFRLVRLLIPMSSLTL